MANEQNLVPNEARTPEERRENARKAGIASGVARAKKRTLREIAEMVGTMELKDPKMLAALHAAGFKDPITNDDAAFFGLCRKAQSGDPSAMKLLAEMRGQYSTRVEVEPVQPKPLIDLTEQKEAK
jgi:hypothetical protein